MAYLETLDSREQAELLCQVDQTPCAILILEIAKQIYEAETKDVLNHGKFSKVVKEDLRFKLGVAGGMEQLLKRINDARQSMKNQ